MALMTKHNNAMRKIAFSTSVTLMVVGLTTKGPFSSRAEAGWPSEYGQHYHYAHLCSSGWLLDYHFECDWSNDFNCEPMDCGINEDPAPC